MTSKVRHGELAIDGGDNASAAARAVPIRPNVCAAIPAVDALMKLRRSIVKPRHEVPRRTGYGNALDPAQRIARAGASSGEREAGKTFPGARGAPTGFEARPPHYGRFYSMCSVNRSCSRGFGTAPCSLERDSVTAGHRAACIGCTRDSDAA